MLLLSAGDLEPIRITLNSVNAPGLPNPPLGCAFAAPFGKGGRQTRSDWRGDFYPRPHPCWVIRTGTYKGRGGLCPLSLSRYVLPGWIDHNVRHIATTVGRLVPRRSTLIVGQTAHDHRSARRLLGIECRGSQHGPEKKETV